MWFSSRFFCNTGGATRRRPKFMDGPVASLAHVRALCPPRLFPEAGHERTEHDQVSGERREQHHRRKPRLTFALKAISTRSISEARGARATPPSRLSFRCVVRNVADGPSDVSPRPCIGPLYALLCEFCTRSAPHSGPNPKNHLS